MKAITFTLLTFLTFLAFAEKEKTTPAIEDSLSWYGKTFVVISEGERIPDTLVLEGKKFIAVQKDLDIPGAKGKKTYIITSVGNIHAQALDLQGKIYLAETEVAMADILRSNGKIYTVVGVLTIILLGFLGYLISIDRKIHKIR